MKNVVKKKEIQLTALILLIISYFLPWYTTYSESSSLFLESISYLEIVFISHSIPLIYDFGNGIWGSITLNMLFILSVVSTLLPILCGITIYKIIKNMSYVIYKKFVVVLTIAIILNYINYFLFFNSADMDTSLKFGLFIALISLISLIKHAVIEKKLNELISHFKSNNQQQAQKKSEHVSNSSNETVRTTTGESNIEVNFCSSCGHKVEDNVRFCVNCGRNISDDLAESSSNNKRSTLNIYTQKLHNPVIKQSLNKMNNIVKKNPVVSILVAIFVTVLLVVVLVDSPEEATQNAFKNNEENALEAAGKSVENQIEIDGFKFVKVKEMEATMTREENINTQQSGIFKVSGIAILKDTEGKKHDDIPFQLYVEFYQGEYYAQNLVDIRYGYPLIEQLN